MRDDDVRDEARHPFAEVMTTAAGLVGALMPVAVRDADALPHAINALDDAQVRAALVLVEWCDRRRQAGGVRVRPDVEALDWLAEAGDGVSALRDAVLALDMRDARHALAELLVLHRDLKATELQAAAAAQWN
jgi:hypothetical protein